MKSKIKNICCIGAGYVGGPTMAVLADRCPHIKVSVVDINQSRIDAWNNEDLALLPIYEPGLKAIISRCRNKNLFFSDEVEKNIAKADMIFLSVNTPTKTKGIGAGQASDLKWIEKSARQIANFAKGETIVVEKSTLPVRTAETIQKILREKNKNNSLNKVKTFSVLSNPEFLAEGTAIKDLESPDRVLIGGEDIKAIEELKKIYLNWIDPSKIIISNIWSSELSKLIANAFLAQRISSINSITSLCEATGANIKEVSKAIGLDSRIGTKFIKAGPGFGGSCFKKDILNLIYICNYYGLKEVADYWSKVLDINNWQKQRITEIIIKNLFGTVDGKKLAILGFAFKANTNDTRESPAIEICKNLINEGANLAIYDPKVSSDQIEKELNLSQSNYSEEDFTDGSWESQGNLECALKGSDAAIILTEWEMFEELNWAELTKLMRSPYWIFDTRNITKNNLEELEGLNLWRLGIDQ